MKKEYIIIVLGVIVALLFAGNLLSFNIAKQLKNNVAQMGKMLQQKDEQIKMLTEQAKAKQQELDAVKQKLSAAEQELIGIKTDLENLNKKVNAPQAKPTVVKGTAQAQQKK
jgi:septal ring factor EnvC (AmiA/AmiB activator)